MASDNLEVILFNPDWKPFKGFGFKFKNCPFLGIGVVNIGTWNIGWLFFLCSTSPTAVVPVCTPGKLL